MKTNQPRRQGKGLGVSALTTLAALILLGSSQNVLAQLWNGPDANGNIYNTNSGNVGIGTQSPNFRLEVKNSSYSPGINVIDSGAGKRATIGFGIDSSISAGWVMGQDRFANGTRDFYLYDIANNRDIIYGSNTGNVGIGTTSPGIVDGIDLGAYGQKILHVLHSGVARVSVTGSGGASTDFIDSSATANQKWFVLQNIGGKAYYRALSDGATISYELMTFNLSNGNVGIGTTTPSAKLDVNGSVNVSGNINAKFQDVAEWVPSSEKLSTGTVVVLDSTKSNQVIASTVSYDTRVAGVISEQAGIALGEKGDSKVLVATTGRVRMKVDATRAPIHIGDLLVTSDVPGVAMKSEPLNLGGVQIHRPGTLIGKALEPLEKGSGTILVLLSLQ